MMQNSTSPVPTLLSKVQSVYRFLLEEDILAIHDKMRDTLARIAYVVRDCACFIRDYLEMKDLCMSFQLLHLRCSDCNLGKRFGKNITSETQNIVNDYCRMLDELVQQYCDCTVRDMHINVYHALENVDLDGMAYAGGTGHDMTKKCLDGTRTEVLREVVDWIHDPDVNVPRILWLHGQAGKGKSAIAHTIALWFKNSGGLGSCFCFARDRQAERREEKMLTTISRDLADHDPTFRRALAGVLANNHSLMATPDIIQQWEKLIVAPLSQVSSKIAGNIVIVVDALDESGPELSRGHILSVLGSPQTAKLPSNFRLLVTSRPLPDIQAVLSGPRHVKVVSLDDVPVAFTKRDIRLFVSMKLGDLEDIGEAEVSQISQKADGLFEWARLACEFIKQDATSEMVKKRFGDCVASASGQGKGLLDEIYLTILDSIVSRRPTPLLRFRSVMRQVLNTLEPLPIDGLNAMRTHFLHKHDGFNVAIVLHFMGPVLSGVTDHANPVRPLHASFYDFLLDKRRSGDFFIEQHAVHHDLAVASLSVMQDGLQFNICGLETSYLCNSEVVGLEKKVKENIPSHLLYSCRFWAAHLRLVEFDSELLQLVRRLVTGVHMLFWLEALGVSKFIRDAYWALLFTERWLQVR